MGNGYSSKKLKEDDDSFNEENVPKDDNMMRTPVADLQEIHMSKDLASLLDPRSPTIGVCRTPVEVVAERERIRLDRERKLQALTDKNTLNVPTTNQGNGPMTSTPNAFFDPRSPTYEYKRTPIAMGSMDITESGDKADEQDSDITPIKTGIEFPSVSITNATNQLSRDLRKRLFVSQLNDSLNASGIQEENKEN